MIHFYKCQCCGFRFSRVDTGNMGCPVCPHCSSKYVERLWDQRGKKGVPR